MSLYEAIFEKWEDATLLIAKIPASKFLPGTYWPNVETTLPYAVGFTETDNNQIYSAKSKTRSATFRIKAWSCNEEEKSNVIKLITDEFDRSSWVATTFSGQLNIIDCRVGLINDLEEDDGIWQAIIDLEITYKYQE